MKRKGFIGDYAFYFIYIFIFCIVIIVGYIWVSEMNTVWQADAEIPAASKTIFSDSKDRFLNTWNWLAVFLLLGILISVIILAWLVQSHPVFAMLSFLVMVVLGGVAVFLSNAFRDFITTSEVVTYAQEFTIIPFVMERLPYFVVFFGFIFIIVMYAKSKSSAII